MIKKIALVIWLAAVIAGFAALILYNNRPGKDTAILSDWPNTNEIVRSKNKPTLVMFVHSKCPCTRASVNQLAWIMAQAPQKLEPHVVVLYWPDTALARQAGSVPGVKLHVDADAKLARLFGAETSGVTLLFDPQGRLLFRGGITDSRGHEGSSIGRESIVRYLKSGASPPQSANVFGCAIQNEEDEKWKAY